MDQLIQTPTKAGSNCTSCGHPMDPHQMLLVITNPAPAGCVVCPHSRCECFATWGAGTRRSTPEEAAATRAAVLARLRTDGLLN